MASVSNLSFYNRPLALVRNHSSMMGLTLHHDNSMCDRPHLPLCQSLNRYDVNVGWKNELQR